MRSPSVKLSPLHRAPTGGEHVGREVREYAPRTDSRETRSQRRTVNAEADPAVRHADTVCEKPRRRGQALGCADADVVT
jgi:hypothetical protein